MQPTNHLRFVEKEGTVKGIGPKGEVFRHKVKILQQWWANDPDSQEDFLLRANGEWCDVHSEGDSK